VNLNGFIGKTAVIGSTAAALALMTAMAGAQDAGDITIGTGVHPESITGTPDGGFIAASAATNNLYRWAPGDDAASVWATIDEGSIALGTFVAAGTVYACQISQSFGDGTLITFDLDSAERTGAYPLPGGGLCNDIAAGPDGTIFITDTGAFAGNPGRVLALVPVNEEGDLGFQTVFASSAIGGADGLAFVGDTLYVNDVISGALFALELSGTTLVDFEFLSLSRDLSSPDGMRTTADGTGMWVVENDVGRVAKITVDGDTATIDTVGEGDWVSTTSIVEIDGTLYVVDTNFPGRGTDEGAAQVFFAHAVNAGM